MEESWTISVWIPQTLMQFAGDRSMTAQTQGAIIAQATVRATFGNCMAMVRLPGRQQARPFSQAELFQDVERDTWTVWFSCSQALQNPIQAAAGPAAMETDAFITGIHGAAGVMRAGAHAKFMATRIAAKIALPCWQRGKAAPALPKPVRRGCAGVIGGMFRVRSTTHYGWPC